MGVPLFGQEHFDRDRETDGEEGHDWQGTTGSKRIIRACHRVHRRRDVISLEIDDGHGAVGSRLVPNHLCG